MFDLSTYLASQVEGEIIDRNLGFTLNSEAVAERLAPFQKELPCYGLLVYAQALTKLRAESLKATLKGEGLSLEAFGNFPETLLQEIESAYQANRVFENTAVSYFARSLHCIAPIRPQFISLGYRDKVIGLLGKAAFSPSSDGALRLDVGFSSNINALIDPLKKAFIERCAFLPYEVSVNNSPLKRKIARKPGRAPANDAIQDYLELIEVGSGFWFPVDDLRNFEARDGVLYRTALDGSDEKPDLSPALYSGLTLALDTPTVAVNQVVCLNIPENSGSPAYILAVSDGVIVEVIPDHSLPSETIAIVDATSLQKGLSGFKIAPNEEFEALRKKLIAITIEGVNLAKRHLPQALGDILRLAMESQSRLYAKNRKRWLMRILDLMFGIDDKLKEMKRMVESQHAEASSKELDRLDSWLKKQIL